MAGLSGLKTALSGNFIRATAGKPKFFRNGRECHRRLFVLAPVERKAVNVSKSGGIIHPLLSGYRGNRLCSETNLHSGFGLRAGNKKFLNMNSKPSVVYSINSDVVFPFGVALQNNRALFLFSLIRIKRLIRPVIAPIIAAIPPIIPTIKVQNSNRIGLDVHTAIHCKEEV